VNRFYRDVVAAARPITTTVVGEFTPRGGLHAKVTATWSKRRGARE
jgi:7-cyano-7-deazaguanine reductase